MNNVLRFKWAYIVVGCVVIVVAVVAGLMYKGGKPLAIADPTSPASGPEGTSISIALPQGAQVPAGAVTAVFTDPNEHGYSAVQQGGGTFVTYDPARGLKYSVPATKNTDGSYRFEAPQGMCGLVIASDQAPAAPPKVVQVVLTGPDGQPIPGSKPQSFQLQCDKYTLKVAIKASKDPVLPDGADSSTVTATLSVTGPAQFVNGQRVKPGAPKITLTSPLGLVMVNFSTNIGTLAEGNPANIKTDRGGQASVTVSSADAGIARVRAVALGIGDASVDVHFPPKITAVKMDFVEPVSPTNYQITTIPANPKDLTIDWNFIPAPGIDCGHMTGPASGKALVKNGFFHGPQSGYSNGCPEDWEHASKVKVTATDKDGQSDTKTFGARAFEGQGVVKL